MTYREYRQLLRNEISVKQIKVIKAEDKLYQQGKGFVDTSIYSQYVQAHEEWQKAENTIFAHLKQVKDDNINLDDEMAKGIAI